jgi:hypothetical protein
MTAVAAPPRATTPQLLKQGMYASAACSLLVLIAVTSGARSHREGIQIIGRDTAPSIIAAQHVSAAMADMDAAAASELLSQSQLEPARQSFDNRRKEASEVLIEAAENIKYEEERAPIRKVALGLSSYSQQIQRALDLRKAKDPAYVDAYRAAAQTMDETLLPAALELDHAKRTVLDRAYADQQKWSSASMLFLVLAILALIGVLLSLQVFLVRRMRRMINPLLMISTGLAFLSFFIFADDFTTADRQLKVAKQDAFESIHALWKARAVAYTAKAAESRYTMDVAHAAQYEQGFQQKVVQVNGYLADELKNITFPGEQDAANKTVAAFAEYTKAAPGKGANAAFDQFDDAIGDTLQINQSAFDGAIKNAFDAVNNVEITASIICGTIALLAFGGTLPRLREYSAA